MGVWQFLDYITENHVNPVSEWYQKHLDDDGKAQFDILVKIMSVTEDWDEVKEKERKYKELERDRIGLAQLMFKVKRKNFRPIGLLRRQEREFIFLGGCEKHPFWTVPPNAFDEALRLKAQLEQGRGATREHWSV
jgi:hypothetical protein